MPLILLSLLAASCGIDRKGFLGLAYSPVSPPLASKDSGDYDAPFGFWLDRADGQDGEIWYTTDASAPVALGDPWKRWGADNSGSLQVRSPLDVRAFTYVDETHYSTVASFSYVFHAPQPSFSISPGGYQRGQTVSLNLQGSQATLVYFTYTTNGSEPADPVVGASLLWPQSSNPLSFNYTGSGQLWVKALSVLDGSSSSNAGLSGWSPSPVLSGRYWIDWASAGLGFSAALPQGQVSLSGSGSLVLIRGNATSGDLTVTANNPNMVSWKWYLNGTELSAHAGKSVTVGYSGPTDSSLYVTTPPGLPLGAYVLSCIATDGNGYPTSDSLTFYVVAGS